MAHVGRFGIDDRGGGWKGYQHSALVLVDEASVGLIAWGGQSQKGSVYVSLMGSGCALVGDVAAIVAYCQAKDWPLRRVDIAADVIDGSVGIETIRAAHEAGKFQRGGRPPKLDYAGPYDGSHRGRTVYVGDRENDVFFRGYEKGLKELGTLCADLEREAKGLGDNFWSMGELEVDGVSIDPRKWFRCELELKAKKRPIPYDVVQCRDQYFAGAYPFLAELLPNVEPEAILTPQKQGEMSVEEAVTFLHRQFGAMLYTLQAVHGGDAMAVWQRIVGRKHSESLLRAGALLGRIDA